MTTGVHHKVNTTTALPETRRLPTLLIISCKFRRAILRLGSIKACPHSEQLICRPTRHQLQLILSARDAKLEGGTLHCACQGIGKGRTVADYCKRVGIERRYHEDGGAIRDLGR